MTKIHVNVGTIGHIDHGITTLTAAILAIFLSLSRNACPFLSLSFLILVAKFASTWASGPLPSGKHRMPCSLNSPILACHPPCADGGTFGNQPLNSHLTHALLGGGDVWQPRPRLAFTLSFGYHLVLDHHDPSTSPPSLTYLYPTLPLRCFA